MKFQFKNTLFVALATALSFASCTKDETTTPTPTDTKGSLILNFDNVVGTQNLQLNSPSLYTNAAGEQFSVSMFKYYISNIKLKKADGTEYVVPQDSSYFLVDEEKAASQMVKLNNVPTADYTDVTFTIGVDSARNTFATDKRQGVLDVLTCGMYWSWNSGYIFVKMEGSSTQIDTAGGNTTRKYRNHIGLYGGGFNGGAITLNNVKTISRSFNGAKATVSTTKTPEVHLTVNALKMWEGRTTVSLRANPTVMASAFSATIANNYTEMFQIDHVHN